MSSGEIVDINTNQMEGAEIAATVSNNDFTVDLALGWLRKQANPDQVYAPNGWRREAVADSGQPTQTEVLDLAQAS